MYPFISILHNIIFKRHNFIFSPDGHKYYLFVAIDRATRLLYYKVYENKSSENASEFLKECKDFFPFYLTHILTDKGLEFTDKWARGKGVISVNHRFDACAADLPMCRWVWVGDPFLSFVGVAR